jgi:hypothetical protein
MLNEDLLKNEVVIRIWNQPDQMEGLPEILETLGLNVKAEIVLHYALQEDFSPLPIITIYQQSMS